MLLQCFAKHCVCLFRLTHSHQFSYKHVQTNCNPRWALAALGAVPTESEILVPQNCRLRLLASQLSLARTASLQSWALSVFFNLFNIHRQQFPYTWHTDTIIRSNTNLCASWLVSAIDFLLIFVLLLVEEEEEEKEEEGPPIILTKDMLLLLDEEEEEEEEDEEEEEEDVSLDPFFLSSTSL